MSFPGKGCVLTGCSVYNITEYTESRIMVPDKKASAVIQGDHDLGLGKSDLSGGDDKKWSVSGSLVKEELSDSIWSVKSKRRINDST